MNSLPIRYDGIHFPQYGYPPSTPHGIIGGPNSAFPFDIQNNIPRSFANRYGAPSTEGSDGLRPSWTQRVMNELKDMLLVLSADGRIKYASPSCESITGHAVERLTGNFLEEFMHEDDKSTYQREMDEAIATRRSLRFHFRFTNTNNTFSVLEVYGHAHIGPRATALVDNVSDSRCDGFFLLCRPYPTKSSQLLDSFLEHKVENIRLNQRIAELKREEEEDLKAGQMYYLKSEPSGSWSASSESRIPVTSLNSAQSTAQSSTATVTDRNGNMDSTLNLDHPGSTTASENQSERNARLENIAHVDGIEVLTGLRYGDGERSQGLSTGDRRARLIQCDIDLSTAVDQRVRTTHDGDKRKRLKGEYVCGDCGTSDSPEWRKGPNGPKTLCNACGLRWAKREKKRQESN